MLDLQFKTAESLERPAGIDTTLSEKVVYIRINIKAVKQEDQQGNEYTKYVYSEATVDKEAFNQYKNMQEALGNKITAANLEYSIKMNTPVIYPKTGFTYLPAWAENIYITKITQGMAVPSIFPMDIYDTTNKKENAVSMSIDDLKELTEFLGEIQKRYFEEKKHAEAEA